MSPAEPTGHEAWMDRALDLARQAWGRTHPNPMVGAVIVEDGAIVAEGFHTRAGEPHAEVMALRALGRPPRPGATLYVTLEPCSTTGRTPPCTEAILAAGLRRVVVGATDPNPRHAGRGLALLRAAGVEVVAGVREADCADLNLIFNHAIATGRPLFAAKMATTLDGRIATRTGESKWITGEQARADVMRWRRLFPAILVGAGTVERDDPRLTARLPGEEWCPVRLVLDAALRIAGLQPAPRLIDDEFRGRTVVVTTEAAEPQAVAALRDRGVQVWLLPADAEGVAPAALAERCAREGLNGVLVEGGARVMSRWFRARAFDYCFAYRAPRLFADELALSAASGLRVESPAEGLRLVEVRHAALGDDQLLRGRVVYPAAMTEDPAAIAHARHR